jgi:Na+/proline symporter
MVQRMLTSVDPRRSQRAVILSGLADLPVVVGFLAIGILLWRFYQMHPSHAPAHDPGIFAWFMVRDLAPGLRGLLAAGLFATAMGSLSTALNALATTFTKDWYVGVLHPQATSGEQMRAARVATAGFAVLLALIGIGTAWLKLKNPELRIIPIVLGSFGYTYGSLLGVFMIGLLTKSRGNCSGNVAAMLAGLLATLFLSGAHNDVWDIIHDKEARVRRAAVALAANAPAGGPAPTLADLAAAARLTAGETGTVLLHRNAREPLFSPPWLPTIAFTWRIMAGTLVTLAVGLCFRSRKSATVPGPPGPVAGCG